MEPPAKKGSAPRLRRRAVLKLAGCGSLVLGLTPVHIAVASLWRDRGTALEAEPPAQGDDSENLRHRRHVHVALGAYTESSSPFDDCEADRPCTSFLTAHEY